MTSRPKKREEGFVACSPVEWAQMVLHALNIADKDPQKNEKLWEYGIKEHVFSSGSDLTKEDYLRLRVLWYTWPEQSSFRNYMRDNPALIDEEQNSTPYTGYINPNNDEIAEAIYTAIRPEIGGYLSDIERVGREDATRPSSQCGIFWMTRYWQGLLAAKLKEVYDEDDKKRHFRGKVRKSEAGLPQPAGPSRPPQTPTKQKQTRQPHEGFGTPAVDRAGASAGGLQNPATADETYVNTALLLMLQTITRLMTDLEEKHRIRSNPSNRSPSTVNSQPGSRTGSRERERASPAGSQVGSRSGNVDQASRETSSRPGSQQSSRAHSSTNIKSRDDKRERSPDPIAVALSQVRGLRHLDWLADRLALNLMDRSPAPASRPSKPSTAKKLMEARVDGYLCRRDFVQSSGDDAKFYARFNKYPLAILEAKPFTRMSALSAIRWQESAEIASWVSGLDDAYENAGLLRSSTSGRKRSVPLPDPTILFIPNNFCTGSC